jgi:hypothetical protein
MLRSERRSKVLAKLTNARCEIEDALKLSIPVVRNDSVLMPELLRHRLSSMIHDLNGVLREIEGSPSGYGFGATSGSRF